MYHRGLITRVFSSTCDTSRDLVTRIYASTYCYKSWCTYTRCVGWISFLWLL